MNKKILKSESIKIVARMARGTCLGRLLTVCESQKTISTNVVERHLEDVQECLCDYAHQMSKLIGQIEE